MAKLIAKDLIKFLIGSFLIYAVVSLLIFVRHSVPKIVPGTHPSEWQLSLKGIELAQALAIQLANLNPDIVISSPETKARETGAILAKQLAIPHQEEADIREHELGHEEFRSATEFDAAVGNLFKYPDQKVFGIESADQALRRFTEAVDNYRGAGLERNMILVTHGRILSLFVSDVTGQPTIDFWKSLGMPAFVAFKLPGLTLIQLVNQVKIEA